MDGGIIEKEAPPGLGRTVESALQPVRRELVLVVDYVSGKPLSVHLGRKRNFTVELTDAKEMILDSEVSHENYGTHADKSERGSAKDLSVIFPDGTVIAERNAAEALVAVVKRIGVDKVCKVVEEHNLKFNKIPVISNIRDAIYGRNQKYLGSGWLLITHSNNLKKRAFIEKV